MKFFIAKDETVDENGGFDMFLKLGVDDDGVMALLAYPTAACEFLDENVLLTFRADGLHLEDGIDVSGWPVDKNGYIKIIRDK